MTKVSLLLEFLFYFSWLWLPFIAHHPGSIFIHHVPHSCFSCQPLLPFLSLMAILIVSLHFKATYKGAVDILHNSLLWIADILTTNELTVPSLNHPVYFSAWISFSSRTSNIASIFITSSLFLFLLSFHFQCFGNNRHF